jgi:hypothetical protein
MENLRPGSCFGSIQFIEPVHVWTAAAIYLVLGLDQRVQWSENYAARAFSDVARQENIVN